MNEPTTRGSVRYCSSCGTLGYEGDGFCSLCGEPLAFLYVEQEGEQVKRCSHCHSRLTHPYACYCGRCGSIIEQVE